MPAAARAARGASCATATTRSPRELGLASVTALRRPRLPDAGRASTPTAGDPLELKSLVQQEMSGAASSGAASTTCPSRTRDADVDDTLGAYREVLAAARGRRSTRADVRERAARRAGRAGVPPHHALQHAAGGADDRRTRASMTRLVLARGPGGGGHRRARSARPPATAGRWPPPARSVVATDLDAEPARAARPTSSRPSTGGAALGHGADITVTVRRCAARRRAARASAASTCWSTTPRSTKGRGAAGRRRRAALRGLPARGCGSARCDVNVTGTFLCCQVLGTAMARAGAGSIVNIASTYGARGARPVALPPARRHARRSGSRPPIRPARAPCSRSPASSPPTGARRACASTRSPRAASQNGQDADFVARYAERTPLGRMAAADRLRGAHRVPGERRLRAT